MECLVLFVVAIAGAIAWRQWTQRRISKAAAALRAGELLVGENCARTISVVGEYYRQGNLKTMRSMLKAARGDVFAELVLDADNPYDPLAVKVLVLGQHVGYLAREQARKYHQAVELVESRGKVLACRFYLTTGCDGIDEIVLYLPHASTLMKEIQRDPASPSGAGWYPDPLNRHEQRYWDGAAWTEHVFTAGTQVLDPIG